MMKNGLFGTFGLLLAALGLTTLSLTSLGCSNERSAQTEEQQRQIRALRHQNDSLQRQLRTLRDSLRQRSAKIFDLKDDLRLQKKLRPLLLDNRVGLWEPVEQATRIRFGDSLDAQSAEDLVAAFNERFVNNRSARSFNPHLQLQSVQGAVARVGVSDDDQLGERMGSAGSEMYMATLTYALTSLCRIDSVYLDIEYGSHASPDYYSRKTWVSLVQEE